MNTDVTRSVDPSTATGDAVNALRDLLTQSAATSAGVPSSANGVPDPPPGFVLEKEIGVGGMGVVYLARQVGLNRPVALKLVKSADKVDAKALIRFLAEAEAVAAVRHPNVVEVYQYGEYAGQPYMALEFCPGGDLTKLVNREAKTSAADFRRIAELMAQVADGVNAAHAQGIVHRDLKPHNVFLTADGTPKVADFGLAKRGIGSDLTNTQAVMGTPAYMSPEQAGGGTKFVGPEADVWALGVMLYELSCGERPIDTTGPLLDAIARVANGEVSQLRTKAPAVPPDLALIAHKCLSTDPRDRYPTAGGLSIDLRNWLDGKPISARPAGVVEQAVKWAKRNKKLAGMAAAVLLTMMLATGVSLGFGIEANRQADRANKKQKDAEDAAERTKLAEADVKKQVDALAVENFRTNRTLARALLGPLSPDRGDFSDYERNAIWELASLRVGPVPLLLVEEAAGSELTAAQFRNRGRYLDHAVVGLNSSRRREVDALLGRWLRNSTVPLAWRRDLAVAAHRAERYTAAGDMADALVLALGATAAADEWEVLTTGLAATAAHLPADRAERSCGPPAENLAAALGLAAAVAARMQADLDAGQDVIPIEYERQLTDGLTGVCGPAVISLTAELAGHAAIITDTRKALADGLAALSARLPADRAARMCGPAAEGLAAALENTSSPSERRTFAEGLATLASYLLADQAQRVCGKAAEHLAAALKDSNHPAERQNLAAGLAAVASRLTTDRAEAVSVAAAEKSTAERVRATDINQRSQMAAETLVKLETTTTVDEWGEPFTDRWLHKDTWREAVAGLAVVTSGLPRGDHNLRGHLDIVPKPRPLPPQQLVELLKHPFCVKEARRVVLNALEFTYDRKFTDLWEFVAFAEKQHPELDLLTPPKRPEKK